MRRTNAKELNVAEHAMRWCDRNEANSTIGLTGFDWSRRDWLASPLVGFCVLWLKAPIQYYMPGALGNWKSVHFLALLITHHHSLTRVASRDSKRYLRARRGLSMYVVELVVELEPEPERLLYTARGFHSTVIQLAVRRIDSKGRRPTLLCCSCTCVCVWFQFYTVLPEAIW